MNLLLSCLPALTKMCCILSFMDTWVFLFSRVTFLDNFYWINISAFNYSSILNCKNLFKSPLARQDSSANERWLLLRYKGSVCWYFLSRSVFHRRSVLPCRVAVQCTKQTVQGVLTKLGFSSIGVRSRISMDMGKASFLPVLHRSLLDSTTTPVLGMLHTIADYQEAEKMPGFKILSFWGCEMKKGSPAPRKLYVTRKCVDSACMGYQIKLRKERQS